MSTVSKITNRPSDAPKDPIFPRIVQMNADPTFIVWAIGTGKEKNTFHGVVLSVKDEDLSFVTPGYHDEYYSTNEFSDFNGAVTLYNK